MNTVRYLEEEIVIKKAIEVLIKELGPVEAMRFVNMPRKKDWRASGDIENGRIC